MNHLPLEIPRKQLNRFCEIHHISRLALFGSILGPKFSEESDIDFLVTFESEHIPTLFGIVDMEDELEELFGRSVDLKTENDLSPYFREKVLSQSVSVYE